MVLELLLIILEMLLMVLEVVLVVLEVTGPQVSLVKFQTRLSLRPDLYSPTPPIYKRCFRNFLEAKRSLQ